MHRESSENFLWILSYFCEGEGARMGTEVHLAPRRCPNNKVRVLLSCSLALFKSFRKVEWLLQGRVDGYILGCSESPQNTL